MDQQDLQTNTNGNQALIELRSVVKTFFDGSTTQAAAALLDMSDSRLTSDEAEQLTRLIEKAKREGK